MLGEMFPKWNNIPLSRWHRVLAREPLEKYDGKTLEEMYSDYIEAGFRKQIDEMWDQFYQDNLA